MTTADDAIRRAVRFVVGKQRPDGLWPVDRPDGADVAWVSGYAARGLWILTTGHPVASRAQDGFDAACRGLAALQDRAGGWRHAHGFPADADATAWAVLSLLDEAHRRSGAISAAVRVLTAHWDAGSGGFRTQLPDAAAPMPLREATHMPLPGVTGAAIRALALAGAPFPHHAEVAAFVRDGQGDDGLWRSPLWTVAGNASYMALTALDTTKGWTDTTRDRARDGVVGLLHEADGYDLATALLAAPRVGLGAEVGAAVERLREQQCVDGGWPAPVRLRRPYAAGAEPAAAGVEDRVLTTVTAAVALHLT